MSKIVHCVDILEKEKIVLCILLEPSIVQRGYEIKYLPLLRKHIDFNLFSVHVVASSNGSDILLKQRNIHTYLIPFYPSKRHGLGLFLGYFLYLLCAFFYVLKLTSKVRAKVVLSLGGHAYSGLVVAVVSRILQVKSIVRISELTRYIVRSRYRFAPLIYCLVSGLERLTFSLCDIVISNRDMCWYSSKIVAKQRLLSQGVNLSFFNFRVVPAFYSKAFPKLVTVARLEKQKNIESVIEAVGLLKKKYPEVLYYIVGSGPDEVNLQDRVKKFALDGHVCFYGWVSPETIPGLLRSCDVFVLPSFIEGLPSAVLEAMACGLPVILGATRHGWETRFLDGENALIVKGDPRSIAEAIDQLISNEELRSKLIVNGIRYIKEYHDSSKTKTQFTAIVQQVLKAGK